MCKDCKAASLNPEFEFLLHSENSHTQPLQYDIVGTKDTRKRITATTDAPFRYICQLLIAMSDGNTYAGTGFFIGPKTILTAGHNVWDHFTDKKIPVGDITISPARNESTKPFGSFNPASIITSHTGFSISDFNTANDYSIIQLAAATGSTTGYWGIGKWSKDTLGNKIHDSKYLPLPPEQLKLNLCGYPADKGGAQQWLSFNSGFRLTDDRKIITYLNDTKGGHSGSPVWIKRHHSYGGRVLVGIHIAGGPDSKVSGRVLFNRAVFITDAVRDFIKKNTI